MIYRAAPSLLAALEARLVPFGFVAVAPDPALRAHGVTQMHRRKNWNTNRGVVVCELEARDLTTHTELLRRRGGASLGSSWWNQLGLQIVHSVVGPPPDSERLATLVARLNTRGVLVQSVFAFEGATGRFTQARTWGQVITAPIQDAIAATLEAMGPGSARSTP